MDFRMYKVYLKDSERFVRDEVAAIYTLVRTGQPAAMS